MITNQNSRTNSKEIAVVNQNKIHSQALAVPQGSLDAYLQAIHKIPMLEADEEKELAQRRFENEDVDAARQLVMSHLRFVAHIARSYNGYGLPIADLIQEGNVGLMKAVKRFDPTYGVRLVSFAVHWIKAEIHEFVLKNWRIVKVATTKAQRKLFFNLRSAKKRLGWMTKDEVEMVAGELNVPTEEVLRMEQRLAAHDAAFDAPAGEEEDNGTSPVYYLQNHNTMDPADEVANNDWETQQNASLKNALVTLDDRSQDIVKSRWLTDTKSTLHQLAAKYSVSAERIRQLEANAMKKMQTAMAQ